MKFEITALKQLQFKQTVSLKVPLDEVHPETGETQYGEAIFIGRFRQQSDESRQAYLDKITILQENINHLKLTAKTEADNIKIRQMEQDGLKVLQELNRNRLAEVWLGFEKHPKHDFPFINAGVELESNAESIKKLLEISPVENAVSAVYAEEMNPGVKKLLEGNSRN